MRTLLVALLCVGCGGSSNEAPSPAPDAVAVETSVEVDSVAIETSVADTGIDEPPPDTTVLPSDASTDVVAEKPHGALFFVGTSASRSSWICLNAFVGDVKSSAPIQSLGPFGLLDDAGMASGPLGFGQAARMPTTAELDAALKGLHTTVAAYTTKPTSCKDAWASVVPSESDWVELLPGAYSSPPFIAITFGDRVRAYRLGPDAIGSASYGAQVINEGEDAALFELQRKDESGTPIGTPVSLGGSGKIARYAIGSATPLTLPTTGAFAASDLLVDSTPLSLFGASLARLAWVKEDGRGSLVVYVGPASAPTLVLVPWP